MNRSNFFLLARNRLSFLATTLCAMTMTICCTQMQKSSEITLSQLREGFAHPPKEAKVRT